MEKETQTPKEKPNKNIGTLIDMEWDIIAKLYEKLNNPDLT
jgi:hypothetical protein